MDARANPGVLFPRDPRCQSAFAERIEPHLRNIFFSGFADEFTRHGFSSRMQAACQTGISFPQVPRCQSAFAEQLEARVRNFVFSDFSDEFTGADSRPEWIPRANPGISFPRDRHFIPWVGLGCRGFPLLSRQRTAVA